MTNEQLERAWCVSMFFSDLGERAPMISLTAICDVDDREACMGALRDMAMDHGYRGDFRVEKL